MEINLSDWASLVQDVTAGLQALPPGLSNCLDPDVITLLQWLEAVTQVRFCHLCYHLDTNCSCAGVPPSTPLTSWSQIMERTPGYEVTASSSGVTTSSTSWGGMSRLVLPPPGISIWDMFPWKAPILQQPVTAPSCRPPIGRGKRLKATLSMRGLVPRVPQMVPAIHQPPLLPWSQQATLYQQLVQPPIRTLGPRVSFDSSATKPAPTGSRDTDVCGRQVTQGRDDDSQPASHSRGGQERSSVRKTSNPKPRQEGGCPSSSTPGKPLPQPGGITRASPRTPLKNITNYRIAGWRKDLVHILGCFYHYNNASYKEAEWNKWKTKFFKYLGQRQEEWRAIKEEKPLQYMPYMESHFQALTGIKLKGLGQFTGWIKPGSYYHAVVARQGQLHRCLHLAGTEPPKGPLIHPSESCPVTQKEEETPTTSPPTLGKEGSVTQGACSNPPIPMETGGAGDGHPGQNRLRPVLRKNGGETDPQSITGHHLGDGEVGLPIPSHSKIAREGTRWYSSSTSMPVSAPQPIMMWLPREWPATTWIWSQAWQRASTTRYSA